MKLSKKILLIAVVIAFFGVAANAQSHDAPQPKHSSIQLGNQLIAIPSPEGFEEATSQFPQFKQRVEATEAPQNDALLAFLPIDDCELLRKGSNPILTNYTKVSVLRAGREMTLSNRELAIAADGIRKNAASMLDPNSSRMKELDRHVEERLSAVLSKETKIEISAPEILGEFDSKPNLSSFLMLMTYKMDTGEGGKATPVLSSISLLRVKDKIIFVYVFRQYESKADIEAVKATTKKWTSSIVAAN